MSIVVNYTDDDGDERRAVSQAAIGPPSVLLEIDGVGSSYIAQHDIRFSACDPELNDTCTLVVHTNPFSPK